MICVSVGKTSFSACLRLLRTVDCAEIRLDLNSFSAVEIRKIFSRPKTLIAACRPDGFQILSAGNGSRRPSLPEPHMSMSTDGNPRIPGLHQS